MSASGSVAAPLMTLAADPEVAAGLDAARQAIAELRRHPVLRRQSAEASAEATVHAARASAALAGARWPIADVRRAVRGAAAYPADASGQTVHGAVRALAALDRLAGTWSRAPLQALASLHVAAAAGLVPDEILGRPRGAGEEPGDGQDLLDAAGAVVPAPDGAALSARLDSLIALLTTAESAPGLLVAALAHAEVAVVRPFRAGNGVVARALGRAVLAGRGVDPGGLVLWEEALLAVGPAYPLSLAAYATEGAGGVRGWLGLFARAVVDGAERGGRVCDAVLAGRLPEA